MYNPRVFSADTYGILGDMILDNHVTIDHVNTHLSRRGVSAVRTGVGVAFYWNVSRLEFSVNSHEPRHVLGLIRYATGKE